MSLRILYQHFPPYHACIMMTITVKIKRDLKFENHVFMENARPNKVRQAARYLITQKLFVDHGSVYDPLWAYPPSDDVNAVAVTSSAGTDPQISQQDCNNGVNADAVAVTSSASTDPQISQQDCNNGVNADAVVVTSSVGTDPQISQQDIQSDSDIEFNIERVEKEHKSPQLNFICADEVCNYDEIEFSDDDFADVISALDTENDEIDVFDTGNNEIDDNWSEDEDSTQKGNNLGSNDTLLTAPSYMEDNEMENEYQYTFAPGKGQQPMSVFRDKFSEELSYPNIFCGQHRPLNNEREVPVYFSEICKSELRRRDRRAAQDRDNLFFKVKKLQMKTMLDKVEVCMRKCKSNDLNMNAGYLKNPTNMKNIVFDDIGYKFMKSVRISCLPAASVKGFICYDPTTR